MTQLPKQIDPIKFAKQHAQLNGQLSLHDLPRLQEICDQKNNIAEITLEFNQDTSRIYFISGKIKANLNLICQRCNSVMPYEMNISFLLSPVISEERAKNLPKKYEPVFMQDDLVSVYDMIEDEILLALPLVQKHEKCELPI